MRTMHPILWSLVSLANVATTPRAQVPSAELIRPSSSSGSADDAAPLGCVVEGDKLVARDGAPFDSAGWAVWLSRDTAFVGAFGDDDQGGSAGAAYVFVRAGATWTEQGKLTASDGSAGAFFGRSIGGFGDTALVGAPRDDAGSAYVFVRNGTTWTEQAKLTASDGEAGDELGSSVSVWGETALVGAWFDDDNGFLSGSAYVFVRSGTTWTEQAKLTASDGALGDQFGRSVCLSGDRALVGAVNGEAAYVFVRNGTTWSEQAKLTANDGEAGDGFGVAVSVGTDSALVGAFNDEINGEAGAGSAYVFVRTGSTWTQQAKLIAGDATFGYEFGSSVSIAAETAVIGSHHAAGNAGAAYVFERTGTDWNQRIQLLAGDGVPGDVFGFSSSLSGDTVLVGAFNDDDRGTNSGAAYSYRLLPEPQTYCTAKGGLICGTPAIGFDGTPSASATSGFHVEAQPAPGDRTGLLLYTNAGRGAAPFQDGTLCIAPTALRRSVPIDSNGTSGQCDGLFSLDLNCFAAGICGGNPAAFLSGLGEQINCQFWARDSVATGSYLTDALEYIVCP